MTRFTLAVLTVGVLVAVPAALATSPGKNGRVVYMVKDGARRWQVWRAHGTAENTPAALFTVRLDGTGLGRTGLATAARRWVSRLV